MILKSDPSQLPVNKTLQIGVTDDGLLVLEGEDGVALAITPELAVQVAIRLFMLSRELLSARKMAAHVEMVQ